MAQDFHLTLMLMMLYHLLKAWWIYRSGCVTENFHEDYVVECARGLYKCVKHHNGYDNSSHLVKHIEETGYLPVDTVIMK